MKYCIFILIIILLTIVIYNLYNTKIIEEYHEGSNVTQLQSNINDTLNNMNDAFNDYRNYTDSIDTDANKYGSRLSDIDDLYRGSGVLNKELIIMTQIQFLIRMKNIWVKVVHLK